MEELFNIIKTSIYLAFAFMGVDAGIVDVLMGLMVADSIFGIIKALRLGYKFDFKRLLWGIICKLCILFIPIVIALAARGIDYDLRSFVAMIMKILIVNEAISCVTNISSIKTGKLIENTDYITMLLGVIRKWLSSILLRVITAVDNTAKK